MVNLPGTVLSKKNAITAPDRFGLASNIWITWLKDSFPENKEIYINKIASFEFAFKNMYISTS